MCTDLEETLKWQIGWNDLITILKQLHLTGLGGCGHGKRGVKRGCLSLQGGMRGGKLPNQLITSPETVKFIEDTHIKTLCAEKIKEEKTEFCKKALAGKRKNDRAAQRKPTAKSRK